MKKLVLAILCLAGLLQLNAQELDTPQNKFILGGSFSYLYQKNTYPLAGLNLSSIVNVPGTIYSNSLDDVRNHVFAFSPYVGKEISSKWTLGLLLQLQLQNTETEDLTEPIFVRESSSKLQSYGGGIFARFHFFPEKKLNIFLQPAFLYHVVNEEQKHDGNLSKEAKTNYFDIGITPGLLYQISNNFRMTLRFGGLSFLSGHWEESFPNSTVTNEKDFSTFNSRFNLSSLFLGIELSL